jgi:hypothetical protein
MVVVLKGMIRMQEYRVLKDGDKIAFGIIPYFNEGEDLGSKIVSRRLCDMFSLIKYLCPPVSMTKLGEGYLAVAFFTDSTTSTVNYFFRISKLFEYVSFRFDIKKYYVFNSLDVRGDTLLKDFQFVKNGDLQIVFTPVYTESTTSTRQLISLNGRELVETIPDVDVSALPFDEAVKLLLEKEKSCKSSRRV